MNANTIRTITRGAKAYRKFELFLGKAKEESKTLQKLDANGFLGKLKYGVLAIFGGCCLIMIVKPEETKQFIAEVGPPIATAGTVGLTVLQVLSGKNDEFIRSERESKGDLADGYHTPKPIIRVEDAEMAEEAMSIIELLADYDPQTIKQRVMGTDPETQAERSELLQLRERLFFTASNPHQKEENINVESDLTVAAESPVHVKITAPDGKQSTIPPSDSNGPVEATEEYYQSLFA
jgi:hypothetical protein